MLLIDNMIELKFALDRKIRSNSSNLPLRIIWRSLSLMKSRFLIVIWGSILIIFHAITLRVTGSPIFGGSTLSGSRLLAVHIIPCLFSLQGRAPPHQRFRQEVLLLPSWVRGLPVSVFRTRRHIPKLSRLQRPKVAGVGQGTV